MKSVVGSHFDKVAKGYDSGKQKYSYYYDSLKKLLKKLIPQNKKVFEFGCGTGDLLASLNPKSGFGMDISDEMVKQAKSKYKSVNIIKFSTKWPSNHFDYIFMSDVIEHLEDPKKEFEKISELMDKKSTFIITMANPVWEPILMFWEKMGWKMKEGPHLRIGYRDLEEILNQSGLTIIKHDYKLLMPINIPIVTNYVNKYLEKFFKKYAFIEYFVAAKV